MYVHVGFFEEALQHAAPALTINPSNAQALNTRAQALLWMGKDEEALAILLSIPGPVLPELVEANSAFALLRLGEREDAWRDSSRALDRYPNDPSGALPGIEAMLLAPIRARQGAGADREGREEEGAQSLASRRVFRRLRPGADGAGRGGRAVLREAAETGFPCYPLFARRRQPRSDPPGPALPGVPRRHAEAVGVPAEGAVQWRVTSSS